MNPQQQEAKRERGRGRIYQRPGVSAFWWMCFYKNGKQFRMSTGETDEKKALSALKRKLVERDTELGGGKKMLTPQQQRITVLELLDALKLDFKLRGKDVARLPSNLKPLEEHFGDYRATQLTSADVDKFIAYALQTGFEKPPAETRNRLSLPSPPASTVPFNCWGRLINLPLQPDA
jgi:hypothetical protein